ncbi:hypothetical protein C2G38_2225232 [Gigaspora rosea]|uniref:Uncharacterized protein n=1 Tax=Gigaspora rosea TaxID=44941 RepID=A0A397TZK3_9GLOM|nr:hypothetical protein C2G38_2225232 [Gigaspora rosea]
MDLLNEFGFERIYKVASSSKASRKHQAVVAIKYHQSSLNCLMAISTNDKLNYHILHMTIHFNEVNINEETISSNKPIYDIVEYSNEIKDVDYQETCSNTSNELIDNMADIINNDNFQNNSSNNNLETEDIIEIFIKEANEDMMANSQIKTALETLIRNYKKACNI